LEVTEQLIAELKQHVRGDVQFDAMSRALYATDASIYQIEPVGVVLPKDEQDVAEVLRLARRHHVAVLPRGGATSLAGQAVGRAIHIDFTKYMHRILEVNPDEGWAWVEPGVVLDHLNAALATHQLKFAPDVSPSNRAAIGGMIGTNAAGMYSLVYGKTIDHVLELKVMLSDGSLATFKQVANDELQQKLALDSLEGRAYRTVRRLSREHADEIERRYPKILRRVGGYNLDAFIDDKPFNMAHMIVGSEGTLAVVLAAKVKLVPRPKFTGISVVEFPGLDAALDAVVACLECGPAAVELMDDMLLSLTRRSLEYSRYLRSFIRGNPETVLQVEFFGDTHDEVVAKIDRLEQHLSRQSKDITLTRALTSTQKQAILQVRKAGLPLLMSISPDRKPETFVEDSAVAPEKLSSYIRRFREIVHAHGAEVAFYGHASVGLMHARPLLNLRSSEDVAKMRSIAEAIKDLVIEFGGALSGEHGDGIVRSEFNRELFGDTLYGAFREIKRTFDPHGLLNPGKIVDAPPMDSHLRYGPNYRVTLPLQTHFHFRDTGGFAGAAELCNGNGLCRKTASGTMCPSYMVTRDEEHSTRGRANALRMVLSGALPPSELTSKRMHDVLDLCIECKGCTGECPSRVNMTRLKAEWLTKYYAVHGTPLRARLFGYINLINRIGSTFAPVSNWALGLPGVNVVNEKLFGISRHRRLPHFARQPFHAWFHQHQPHPNAGRAGSVVLFPDTFATYNEPEIGQAAVRLLEVVGYTVVLPQRQVCCGRPMISKGLLEAVKELAQQQMEWLAPYAEAGLPIVGLEPSCILTFRDEYPDLLDDPRAVKLAERTFLVDEFLAKQVENNDVTIPLRKNGPRQFLLHGHCHQKALVGSMAALRLLRLIPDAEVREVDSGCCGMAGSFGYEAEHYAISQAIGERVLLPTVRALPPEVEVVAMGTSCRQQIAHGTERRARHLVEVLADTLDVGHIIL
jgi:FAD/FMN-containing dehydrogenase/Fe-S oxidoreductase